MKRRRKTATEYGRERLEAQRYADDVASREAAQLSRYRGLEEFGAAESPKRRAVWQHAWGVAFNGYLAGLRRKHRKDPSKK